MTDSACAHWETFQDDDGTWCDECGCLIAVDPDLGWTYERDAAGAAELLAAREAGELDDCPPSGIPRPTNP